MLQLAHPQSFHQMAWIALYVLIALIARCAALIRSLSCSLTCSGAHEKKVFRSEFEPTMPRANCLYFTYNARYAHVMNSI